MDYGEDYVGLSFERDFVITDDATFHAQYLSEEKFEVDAPSGTLGLVLEANDEGIPQVNGIRDNSVLVQHVRLGDCLLALDGQDVTGMLTSNVSQLIASKQDQATRKLTFLRRNFE
jgi:C-terminal processing protease CtpA/Prc